MSNNQTTPTLRYRCAGAHQPAVLTSLIEQQAKDAAKANQALYDACPYPFGSEAGQHFSAVWFLHTSPTEATVFARPPAVPTPQPA